MNSHYKQEIRQLENAIPKDVLAILAHEKCFIAGGALTSIFTGTQINDIDIYFRSRDSLDRVMQVFCDIKDKGFTVKRPVMAQTELSTKEVLFKVDDNIQPVTITKKSVVFSQGNGYWNPTKGSYTPQASLQFISFQYFDKPEDIFDTFDFSINMAAYDCASGELTLHDNFLKHLARRSLVVNTDTAYPLISLLRCDKYKERGYNISTKEQMSLMFAVANMEINSWEDAKDHIGGMYGFDVEDLFDEDEEFSLDKVIGQLKSIEKDYGIYDKKVDISLAKNGEGTYTQWKMRERVKDEMTTLQEVKWYIYDNCKQDKLEQGKVFPIVLSKEGDFLKIIEDSSTPLYRNRSKRGYENIYEVQVKNLNKVHWLSYKGLECVWDNSNMLITEKVDLTTFEELGIVKKF